MTTFYTGFITSTLCLLTYLKIRKIEGGKISQPTHPSTNPPITIKLFRKSKKADNVRNLKTQNTFPNHKNKI